MSIVGRVITVILLIGFMLACVGTLGTLWSDVRQAATNRSEIRDLEAEIEELELEAETEDARARQLEAQAEIEAAQAEQLRAAGEKAQHEASAYVTRQLGAEASAAIRRQGRLLTLYTTKSVLGDSGRMIFVGILIGLGTVAVGLLALSYCQERWGGSNAVSQ